MLLSVFAFSTANAQILKNQKKRAEKRAQQRAKNKAQNKADRKVDEAVDDAFESIGSLFKKKKKQESTNQDNKESSDSEEEMEEDVGRLASMFGGDQSPEDLDLPNRYAFNMEVRMKMTSINKKGKEESTIFNYLLADKVDYMGYLFEQEAMGIMDMGRMKMVSIVTSQNMATVMDMKKTLEMAEDYQTGTDDTEVDIDDIKITKTGKTKTIAGYKCTQYLINSEETEGEIWKAEDFDKMDLMKMGTSLGQVMKQNKQMKMPPAYAEFIQDGFLFEGNFYDKKSKERSIMLVEEVMEKDRTIDLTKYRLMDMSQFMKN